MSAEKDYESVPTTEWSLVKNWHEEGMTMAFAVMMVLGTAFVALIVLVARIDAIGYLGVCGLFAGLQWMPYLMALIYINTDPGTMFTGLYKKLAYAPLTAPVPKWVKRAQVAHSNALENYMLFAIAVIFATLVGVDKEDTTPAAALYFGFR